MAHEPIILDPDDWPKSYPLVQYNLNRCVNNIHDERERLNALMLKAEEHRNEQREADIRRISERYDPLFSRMASVETRVVIYAAVAGGVAGIVLSAVVMLVFKKMM